MPTIYFDDLGLDLFNDGGAAGSFEGDAHFGDDGVVDAIDLRTAKRRGKKEVFWTFHTLPEDHWLFEPIARRVETEYADKISEAIAAWHCDRPARIADAQRVKEAAE